MTTTTEKKKNRKSMPSIIYLLYSLFPNIQALPKRRAGQGRIT